MTRRKAILYAFAAPVLYMLLQMTVVSSISTFVAAKYLAVMNPNATYSQIMEDIMTKTLEAVTRYNNYILILSGAMFVGLMLLAYRNRQTGLWHAVRLNRNVSATALLYACLSGMGFNLVSSSLLTGLPIPEEWASEYEAIMESLLSGNRVVVILITGLLVPFIEELVFRGFTQRFLESAVGPWMAITSQALLFAWFHGNSLQIVYTIFVGILLGMVYMWTRNLWAAIALHAAYNLSGFAFDGLLTLIYGDSAEPLSVPLLAVMAAMGMTLVVFCVRQLHKLRVSGPNAPESGAQQ